MSTQNLVLVCGLFAALRGLAQNAPVIDQRGVINAFTQVPAPSNVAAGSIIWINGLNLGPAAGAVAEAGNLPTTLGGVQVMVNNRPAALFSVDPARIVAQVPLQTPQGLANVIVRRDGQDSRPARINVLNVLPAVRMKDGKGFGLVDGTVTDKKLRFSATGLGPTTPRLPDGELPGADTVRPNNDVTVHIGGIRLAADVRASEKKVGEFDITVDIPAGAKPGDLVAVESLNRLANLGTYQRSNTPEVLFVPIPENAPDLRGMMSSDLRGGFFLASGAPTSDGCWPTVLFDVAAKKAANLPGCLTGANRNAPTPAVNTPNASALAAFIGPNQGDGTPGQAVSNKVMIFSPSSETGMPVELPAAATQLVGLDSNSVGAIIAGPPPQVAAIDIVTGEVSVDARGVGVGGGVPGVGGAGGGALNPLNLKVDLGGGLDKLLTPTFNLGQGVILIAVGDDAANPTKAKIAVLDQQGNVTGNRDFPEGWLPMVMPAAPAGPGGGMPGGLPGIPGLPGGGGGGPAVQFRVATFTDGQNRTVYMMARKADDSAHGMITIDPTNVRVVPVPDKYFIAGCTSQGQILSVETARRLVVLGTNKPLKAFQQVCGALSFLSLDMATQRFTAIDLPGNGEVNATQRADDANDFLLAASTTGDVLYILDGVTLTAYRLDVPQGVTSFANLSSFPALEIAIGVGRQRVAGDAGFLVFDLANVQTRQLLIPDGFASVQLMGIAQASRKLIAKGTKAAAAGSQFLIYDLDSGEVQFADNPPGVAFVGNVPAQPGQQQGMGQQQVPAIQRLNPKANTIEALTFGADRRANGAMLVRIP